MIYDVNAVGDLGGKWITVREAARILQVSRQRISAMIKDNVLNAARYDGRNLLLREQVETLVRRPPGRPRYEEGDHNAN